MKVRYWRNFTKRQNSTKIPTNETYTEIDCYWKEDTSLENPVYLIDGTVVTWGYAYVPDFSRYYFITDIVSVSSNLYEVHMTLDTLGSFRQSILSYTAFVERAASAYDPMVNDRFLSSTQDYISISQNTISLGFSGEMYLMPVAGARGIQLLVFPTLASANLFANSTNYEAAIGGRTLTVGDILDSDDAIKDVFKQVGYSFLNATDYMGTMIAFPFQDSSYTGITLSLGIWEGGNAYAMSRNGAAFQVSLNFSSPYTDFRRGNNNFMQYSVYLPGLGEVPISALDAAENDLYCRLSVDYYTGTGLYYIAHSGGGVVGSYQAQIGSVVPYGKGEGLNFGNMLSTAMGSAQNAVSGFGMNASTLIGLEKMGVDTVRTAFDSNTSVIGGAGSLSQIKEHPDIICTSKAVGSKEFPTVEAGRPLCQNVQLGSLSGFVKCANASVPLNALDHVRTEINAALNSGIYIE